METDLVTVWLLKCFLLLEGLTNFIVRYIIDVNF